MRQFDELIARLRDEGDLYAQTDAEVNGAKICRRIAGQIETALREWKTEELTLVNAAEERGESYSTTRRKVRAGKIRNVGTEKHPKVRRCDLQGGVSPTPDPAAEILGEEPAA